MKRPKRSVGMPCLHVPTSLHPCLSWMW